MSLPLKILWSEGLALDAQHLQQLDRYHEARLQHIAGVLNPHAWGVHTAQWDVDGLARNSLYAVALSLIFKDGEIFDAPHSDILPLAIDLNKLPAEEQSFTFYAALPVMKAHGGNLSSLDAPHAAARYSPHGAQTPDLFTDAICIDVSYLKKTPRLLSDQESHTAYDCFPVVRIRRRADSSFELDPTYMPASVSVNANPALREMLRVLLGKLAAKTESLYLLQRQPKGHTVEANSGDISSFWMLGIISGAGASLSHCAKSGHYPPEHLFEKMTTLAGGLMAFSTKYSISNLPAYDHENPAPGFGTLNAIICELLETVASSRYVRIALDADPVSGHHLGRLDAASIAAGTTLYLAVNADMPALSLVAAVPTLFKVGCKEDVQAFVRSALPGLALVHMPQVPAELPLRPNTYYFSIEKKSERYEAMVKARDIAIYAPGTVKDLKLELFAITA
ncbi:type VI secretion system baseplate subunit TssK [Rugamonas sp. CCM 8940]|uniref:type VI secretion system baseplate subunit TssK n=1 Tax=Rugamonas sp. CCM 8940 TaxID=2765359 RepID=UPI0018F41EBD|nr:type VI secretion system baseplate subunit TssK [Rugamonas sp. CCM 8940]MBJ7308830.1 type VI secretion system baseplate subunit TssK [Rugamonas sp. CCM 8940]